MAEFAQVALYYLSLDQTHWLLTLALILLLAPFEQLFPRVKPDNRKARILAVAAIAISAYAAVWAFKKLIFVDVVSFFLKLQVFSLSKTEIPTLAIYVISLLLLDFTIYAFHFLSHKITPLWRLHSIHHADEHVDAKTGILHHPIETIASLIFVLFFAVTLGIPLIALILYAGIATVHNLVSHSNIALPKALDRVLRLVIVTPDMHRTHHSIVHREGNSNFGQIFSFWDRLFGTYIAHPAGGETKLVMGLSAREKPKGFTTKDLLLHPFVNRPGTKR